MNNRARSGKTGRKEGAMMKRTDVFFQNAYQAYIDSLELSVEEPKTREEWEDIIKSEDVNGEATPEIINGLIDWLDEDGYVTD